MRGGLVLQRRANVSIVFRLKRVVRDAKEINCIGNIHFCGNAPHCQTQTGGSAGRPAKVSRIRAIVKMRIAGRIAAIVASKFRKVIDLPEDAAQRKIVMQAVEISRIKRIAELRCER